MTQVTAGWNPIVRWLSDMAKLRQAGLDEHEVDRESAALGMYDVTYRRGMGYLNGLQSQTKAPAQPNEGRLPGYHSSSITSALRHATVRNRLRTNW